MKDMGRIVDIIVSRDGQIHAAIIDFGGLLGIGTRKIAVDWRALNFAPAGKPGAIILELTRNQVRLAPEYRRDEPVVVVAARPTADVGDDRAVAERPQPGSIIARVRTFPLAWLQHSSARGHRSAANRWTALATTCSIQAKGISPDIEVLQEVPEELK